MTVKINKDIKDSVAYLLHNGIEIGAISTELELNDVRLQIAKQRLNGYYIIFYNGDGLQEISILQDGSLSSWPYGFFDTQQKQLKELVKCKKTTLSEN